MSDKNNKPSSSRKKKTSKTETELGENIEKKIEAAIRLNLQELAKKKKMNYKQMEVINSFIEEHLGCFILLGYTIEGEPVSLANAQTQKDSDSLSTMLQKYITRFQEPPRTDLPPLY